MHDEPHMPCSVCVQRFQTESSCLFLLTFKCVCVKYCVCVLVWREEEEEEEEGTCSALATKEHVNENAKESMSKRLSRGGNQIRSKHVRIREIERLCEEDQELKDRFECE